MSEPVTVQLGTDTITLTVPESPSVRWDVAALAARNLQRARSAALGLCWAGSVKATRADLSRHGWDVGSYGGAVQDALVARGIDIAQVWAAGSRALELVCTNLVSQEEVARQEVFSSGKEGST